MSDNAWRFGRACRRTMRHSKSPTVSCIAILSSVSEGEGVVRRREVVRLLEAILTVHRTLAGPGPLCLLARHL